MIDRETVKHVAKISRINLTEEEIGKMSVELSDIADAFSLLKEVDTEKIKPSFHPIEIRDIVREDVPEESLTQEQALSNSGQKDGKFFRGPRSF
jgi:aspartyl-tRNA(Asn)/glutamyl-tRNA(Gln) amidotransferase subunit C